MLLWSEDGCEQWTIKIVRNIIKSLQNIVIMRKIYQAPSIKTVYLETMVMSAESIGSINGNGNMKYGGAGKGVNARGREGRSWDDDDF